MILLILTADYEIFGNGSGDIQKCLIEPTESLLSICEQYNVPVTFFFDVCEYWAFKKEEESGRLPSGYKPAQKIEEQLIRIVRAGHDVQLHLHPQWLDYEYSSDEGWKVNFDYWRLSKVPINTLRDLFFRGKKTLEDLIRPYRYNYRCFAFRAGAWCIQPEKDILNVMRESGFLIDSTVAPGIVYDNGLTTFDFQEAPLNIPVWRIKSNMCYPTEKGELWEIPIFTCKIGLIKKIFRKLSKKEDLSMKRPQGCYGGFPRDQKKNKLIHFFCISHMRMFDFCEMTTSEMGKAIKEAKKRFFSCSLRSYPLVLIGHPKGFANEVELSEFLKSCLGNFKDDVKFGTYMNWLNIVKTNKN